MREHSRCHSTSNTFQDLLKAGDRSTIGPAGHLASQVVTDSAIQTAVQVVGDVAGGTVAVAVGDSALSSGTASSLGTIEAQLRQLHAGFALKRVSWLMELLNERLWGDLIQELTLAASVRESELVGEVQAALDDLASNLQAASAVDD